MITCRELIETLIDYVSGEMPAELREAIDQHLRKCPPCVTYVETYKTTIVLTRQLPPQPMPPQLKERLQTALTGFCRGQKRPPDPAGGYLPSP